MINTEAEAGATMAAVLDNDLRQREWQRKQNTITYIMGGKMKKYRHRVDGYEIEAEPLSQHAQTCIRTYGYRQSDSAYVYPYSVLFRLKDFEALFEPIEEYCCDDFKWHVERGFFAKNDAGKWASWLYCSNRRCPDGLPRVKSPIEHCQFCGKKLEGGRSK